MAGEEGWIGVEEVAAHLRVAKESISRWVETKAFRAHHVGRLLRFKLSEVDAWVKNSCGADPFAKTSSTASASKFSARRSNAGTRAKKN